MNVGMCVFMYECVLRDRLTSFESLEIVEMRAARRETCVSCLFFIKNMWT